MPICNSLPMDRVSCSEHTVMVSILSQLSPLDFWEWMILILIKTGSVAKLLSWRRHDGCHFVSFVMYILILVPSFKTTALTFLEIFLIECCTVFVEPSLLIRKYLKNEKRYSK